MSYFAKCGCFNSGLESTNEVKGGKLSKDVGQGMMPSFPPWGCGDYELPGNGPDAQWRTAVMGDDQSPALQGQPGLAWDMQAVENVLCGIHGKKTPAAIVASAANEGQPWAPNPCTDCEYHDLYGGVG